MRRPAHRRAAAACALLGLMQLTDAPAQTLQGGISVDEQAPPAAVPAPSLAASAGFDAPQPSAPAALGGALAGVLANLLTSSGSGRQRYDMSAAQVYGDAQRVAAAIDQAAARGAVTDPAVNDALSRLREDQVRLPPDLPRPAGCYGTLVGAWVAAQQRQPANAAAGTQRALACYRDMQASGPPQQPSTQCSGSDDLTQQAVALAAELQQLAVVGQRSARAATDSFLNGMSGAISLNLRWLAQDPGVPVSQAAQALVSYLTTDNATNHAQLYQAALQAVHSFQRDPAAFLGAQAGNATVGAVMGAAGGVTGKLCSAGVRRVAGLSRSLQAGTRLLGTLQADQSFSEAYGAALRRAQAVTGATDRCFAENACFPTALARAELWREDLPVQVRVNGVYATAAQDLRATEAQISERLRSLYGKSFTPRNPAAYSAQELVDIRNGVPIGANAARIEQILMQSGEGSQGLVFVRYKPEVHIVPGQPSGHVFNVRLRAGKVEWVDDTLPSRNPVPNFKWMQPNGFFYPVQ